MNRNSTNGMKTDRLIAKEFLEYRLGIDPTFQTINRFVILLNQFECELSRSGKKQHHISELPF